MKWSHMRRALIVTCALAVVLAGCARGADPAAPASTFTPSETASSPSPAETAFSDEQACRLLTSKERKSISGVKLDAVAPAPSAAGTSQCHWRTAQSAPFPTLNVVTMTSQTWAKGFPEAVDEAVRSGRASKKLAKRLRTARSEAMRGSNSMGKEEACRYFSLILETYDLPRNSRTTTFIPTEVNGQLGSTVATCSRGLYTAITYAEVDLTPSDALYAAFVRLLELAHQRAVKLS